MPLSCSPSLIWTTSSLLKQLWMAPLLFSFLAVNVMFSYIYDKFWLIKILLPSWYFSLSRLANFFRLNKAFLQYFLFGNLTMSFLHLVVLSNLWHASNALESTSASISAIIDVTVASNTLSATHFGIPERTILFLSYWLRLFKWLYLLMTCTYFVNKYFYLAVSPSWYPLN